MVVGTTGNKRRLVTERLRKESANLVVILVDVMTIKERRDR